MKIGFFGGSFNPPTIAHLNLAKQAVHEYHLDKFYYVPVNNYYNKKELIDIDTRCEMLELLCENEEKIFVSAIEKEKNEKYTAIDIFEEIEKRYPNDEIYFIMGEDNYEKMPYWHKYEDLTKYNYIILQRQNTYELKIDNPKIQYMKNNENLKISSTTIRQRLKQSKNINDLVTSEINQYIKKNNLYQ